MAVFRWKTALFLCYHLIKGGDDMPMPSIYPRNVIISRLRAVGNSDNAESVYELYKKNGDLETLIEYIQLKEKLIMRWSDERV